MSKTPHWPLREADYHQALGNRLCWLSSLLEVLAYETVEGDRCPEVRAMCFDLARSLSDDCFHAFSEMQKEERQAPPA